MHSLAKHLTGLVTGLGLALALVALVGCKPKPSDEPTHAPEARRGYTDAYTAGASSIAPIEVCMHLAGMAAAEAGVSEPQFDPQLLADCERELALEAAVRGSENWNGMAACVLQSRSGPDIDACNLAHPLPKPDAQGLPGEDSRERAACDHLVELLLLETAAESGDVPMLSNEERLGLSNECMVTLLDEQQPNLSPADYDALLTCLLDARSSEQIQSC
jgi:hypothetical protein